MLKKVMAVLSRFSEIKFQSLDRLRKTLSCAYNFVSNEKIFRTDERRSRMPSSSAAHMEALQARHAAISHKIDLEQGRPGASDWYLKALKRQRLYLKEQIEGIS